MDIINGYELTKEFSTENAGNCQWGFCTHSGREYFIKRFLSPVYPTECSELSEDIKQRKHKICEDFYRDKKSFYNTLNACRTGNVVVVEDFFRSGSKYYAITDRIYSDGTNPQIIDRLSEDKKQTLLRSVTYSFSVLHAKGLVHADVKPDNILLKKTTDGFYTAKIIDFDSGFLIGSQPKDVGGDFVYRAPEVWKLEHGEKIRLTDKIDIFALGILFHEYYMGKRPDIDGKYHYIYESVLDKCKPGTSDKIPPKLRNLIDKMLSEDPNKRPTAKEILEELKKPDNEPSDDPSKGIGSSPPFSRPNELD